MMMQLGPRPCHNKGILHPFVCSASHLTKEVDQAWLAPGKSTLATPKHLLILCVLRKAFQEELIHSLHAWGYADWPVGNCILLLALLEDVCDICLLPVTGNLPQLPQPFEDDASYLVARTCVCLIGSGHSLLCLPLPWVLLHAHRFCWQAQGLGNAKGKPYWFKREAKISSRISAFSLSLVSRSPATPSSRPTFCYQCT